MKQGVSESFLVCEHINGLAGDRPGSHEQRAWNLRHPPRPKPLPYAFFI